jgi:hypothetical protein
MHTHAHTHEFWLCHIPVSDCCKGGWGGGALFYIHTHTHACTHTWILTLSYACCRLLQRKLRRWLVRQRGTQDWQTLLLEMFFKKKLHSLSSMNLYTYVCMYDVWPYVCMCTCTRVCMGVGLCLTTCMCICVREYHVRASVRYLLLFVIKLSNCTRAFTHSCVSRISPYLKPEACSHVNITLSCGTKPSDPFSSVFLSNCNTAFTFVRTYNKPISEAWSHANVTLWVVEPKCITMRSRVRIPMTFFNIVYVSPWDHGFESHRRFF